MSNLERFIERQLGEMQAEIEQLAAERDEAKAEAQRWRSEHDAHERCINSLNETIGGLESENRDLKGEVAELVKEVADLREQLEAAEATLDDEEAGGLETFDLWKFQEKRADMLYERGNAMHEKGKALRDEVINAALSGREIDVETSIDFGIALAGWAPVLSEATETAAETDNDSAEPS